MTINQSLAGRTVLIAPSGGHELETELMRRGARVMAWPQVEIVEPQSYAALDEAIENLYGYDWLIFANVNAATCFVRRFQDLGHEVSELDALRVCAIGNAAVRQLEDTQIHIDLPIDTITSTVAFSELETFIGGRDSLRGLNFLLPRAAISRDSLWRALEDAGARVDVVSAYRTAGSHNSGLVQLNVLLDGGGIDCVVFATVASVREFSELFDTNEPAEILKEVLVVCADEATALAAAESGLRLHVQWEPGIAGLVSVLTAHLGHRVQ